uniref:Glycogen synthase kinase binding protein n=1 Tax=Cynoglossus semilaevis TaxID=244447 RepID=A0A3P8UG89_CYNSE
MPCRKENYIFLEQSVTVDSKEVDALVTKIGEALQLHNNSGCGGGGGGQMKSMSVSCLSGLASSGCCGGTGGSCCMRLRSRGQRGSSRASPYSIPGSNGEQDWDQIKPWSKKRVGVVDEDDDDPHRLLQELILSGNLIKEAVRRLQFSAAAADNVSC